MQLLGTGLPTCPLPCQSGASRDWIPQTWSLVMSYSTWQVAQKARPHVLPQPCWQAHIFSSFSKAYQGAEESVDGPGLQQLWSGKLSVLKDLAGMLMLLLVSFCVWIKQGQPWSASLALPTVGVMELCHVLNCQGNWVQISAMLGMPGTTLCVFVYVWVRGMQAYGCSGRWRCVNVCKYVHACLCENVLSVQVHFWVFSDVGFWCLF